MQLSEVLVSQRSEVMLAHVEQGPSVSAGKVELAVQAHVLLDSETDAINGGRLTSEEKYGIGLRREPVFALPVGTARRAEFHAASLAP